MSTYQAIDNNDQLKERVRRNDEFRAKLEKSPIIIRCEADLWKLSMQQLEDYGKRLRTTAKEIRSMSCGNTK